MLQPLQGMKSCALHIGFCVMTGRPLNSVRAMPAVLLRHLGQVLDIAPPDLASLRALHARSRTLFDHQNQACEALGFAWMTEHQRRALVRILREEVPRSADRGRLLQHARHWLYEHRLLIVHDRVIRGLVAAALMFSLTERSSRSIFRSGSVAERYGREGTTVWGPESGVG